MGLSGPRSSVVGPSGRHFVFGLPLNVNTPTYQRLCVSLGHRRDSDAAARTWPTNDDDDDDDGQGMGMPTERQSRMTSRVTEIQFVFSPGLQQAKRFPIFFSSVTTMPFIRCRVLLLNVVHLHSSIAISNMPQQQQWATARYVSLVSSLDP